SWSAPVLSSVAPHKHRCNHGAALQQERLETLAWLLKVIPSQGVHQMYLKCQSASGSPILPPDAVDYNLRQLLKLSPPAPRPQGQPATTMAPERMVALNTFGSGCRRGKHGHRAPHKRVCPR